MLRKRECSAEKLEALAHEMLEKGITLVYEGWCEQTVFDKRYRPRFEKIAKSLESIRPWCDGREIVS